MNSFAIVATAWLVIGWIGLVLLVAKTPRNRRASPKRRTRRPQRGGPFYWGGADGGDNRQDRAEDVRGGGDWAGGGDWGGGTWGGQESGSGGWGGGDWGGGSSGGGSWDGGGGGGGDSGGGGGGG